MSTGGPHCIQYLESGCGLCPIDTGYPADRILYTLHDTHATHVITNRRTLPSFASCWLQSFPHFRFLK